MLRINSVTYKFCNYKLWNYKFCYWASMLAIRLVICYLHADSFIFLVEPAVNLFRLCWWLQAVINYSPLSVVDFFNGSVVGLNRKYLFSHLRNFFSFFEKLCARKLTKILGKNEKLQMKRSMLSFSQMIKSMLWSNRW